MPQLTYAEIRPIADVAADKYDLDALALMSIWWVETTKRGARSDVSRYPG